MPGEHLDRLVGPWIEQLPEGRFRVSPLLSNSGKEVLSDSEIRMVHEAVSLKFLRARSVTPWDVATALLHAFAARSLSALSHWARQISQAKRGTQAELADALFWFSSMGQEPEQSLFSENPTCDFFLRLAQFRIAAAAGRQAEARVIVDALRRASRALPTHRNECTALACSVVLGTPEIQLPIELYCDLLLQLAELAAVNRLPQAFHHSQRPPQ